VEFASPARRLCLALLAALVPTWAFAQSAAYPSRPVRFVVAFAPGGIADVAARLIAQKLGDAWGQPVVVENRGGAGGNVGTNTVARAPPDGYTVLVTTTSIAVNPSLYKNPGYDLEKDLVPVIEMASSPNLIVTHPSLGVNSLQELIANAKSGKLNYATAGAGTTPHLTAEHLFRIRAGVDVAHIPYGGAGPAVAAVVAGQVEIGSVAMPPAVPMVRAGRLRGIAVTSSKRIAALPDVPTVAEQGFPGFEDYTWVGLFMPAASPPEAVARLNAEIDRLLATADVKERLAALGFEPVGGSPQQFAAYLRKELAKWAAMVKETGARVD
jgi:tripartite-type tricarboxylate transporter receptor subunit TctC